MPPRRGYVTNKKIDPKSLLRLLKYVFSRYKVQLACVGICLIVSSLASVIAATFMQRLIDEVILPGISSGMPAVADKLMTIIVTAVGTSVGVMITALLGYMLSNKDLPGRGLLNLYVVFTMLFNGGLVPTYIMYVKTFAIKNTIFGLIVPNLLCSAFLVMLVRNYFENSIPRDLYEAARIDGASEFQTFFRVALPLSTPILATIGLMMGLAYWNDWQNGLYYLSDQSANLKTIQNILNDINTNIAYLASNSNASGVNVASLPTQTARMAIAVVGILPILVIYPFFQKYFAKGITMGAVKG